MCNVGIEYKTECAIGSEGILSKKNLGLYIFQLYLYILYIFSSIFNAFFWGGALGLGT